MSIFFHEQLYRTDGVMAKLREFPVTICGAGAVGANLVENLARAGFGKLKVIDRDRIEERNLSTQPYYRSDVGAFKAKILANNLYRAIGTKVEAETKELTAMNAAQLLKESRLIVDVFDNSTSRQVVKDYADQTEDAHSLTTPGVPSHPLTIANRNRDLVRSSKFQNSPQSDHLWQSHWYGECHLRLSNPPSSSHPDPGTGGVHRHRV